MLRNYATSLLVALGSVVLASDAKVADSAQDASPVHRQSAARQEALRASMLEVQQARSFYMAKRYSDAEAAYRKALNLLPKAKATAAQAVFIQRSLSDALVAKAMDYRKVGRLDEAVKFLTEAIELYPDNKLAKRELEYTQDPARTNPALSPQHVANVAEVNRLLTLGYGYYDLGKYDEAIATFESILVIDAYNQAATRGVELCAKRKSLYANAARDSYRAQALNDVDAAYDVKPLNNSGPDLIQDTVAPELALRKEQSEDVSHYLESIIVPNISFEDSSIDDTVAALRGLVRQAESSNPHQGRTINIFTSFGSINDKAYKEVSQKLVNLNVSDLSIKDIIDEICANLGLTSYYTPTGVEITYSGRDFGPMTHRSFSVPARFFEPSLDDEGGDGFSERMPLRRVNPKTVLEGMGVSFPEGSNVRYLSSDRTLHAFNTAYNLDEIAELLDVEIAQEKLVLLNVHLISVSSEKLEELGFDWLLDISLGSGTYAGGGTEEKASSATGLPTIQTVHGGSNSSISSGLRSGAEVFNVNNLDKLIATGGANSFNKDRASKSPGVFGFRGVWTVADLTVLMRGLNQKGGADFLQNPQLLFTPGNEEQVSIACVREMYYPIAYDAPETQSSSIDLGVDINIGLDGIGIDINRVNMVVATAAHPTEYAYYGIKEEEFSGIGTLIKVHSASIEPDGESVTLALSTMVNDFEGFVNWGAPIMAVLSTDKEVVNYKINDNHILMPMFKQQSAHTQVTLKSGSVVVIGGLQEARQITFEDKIPILGDLPYVGRLFRSAGSQTQKRYLLIIAKVDIVDPTGVNTKTGERPSNNK